MEKNIGFVTENSQPSAPAPTTPPSYEEAIRNMSNVPPVHPNIPPVQPNIPPYPTGPTTMPAPSYNQPQMETQYFPNANFVPPSETVRIVRRPVTYALSPNPQKMTCPTCHASIKTTTTSDHQACAHICCIILCLFGCCLCSCLPYCMSSCMSVHHFCPNCKNYIGTWKG